MKNNLTIFVWLLNLVLSSQCLSKEYLMYIGAGGEAAKEDTIFDDSISNIGDYVKQSPAINVDVALNGGHSKTEALIKESFPKAISRSGFLDSDYNRLIENYKSKLENNLMGKGDQLLIYINSHGAEQVAGLKTHQIATGEMNSTNSVALEGAKLVDLDQLSTLKELAKTKGVKLAIVDTSCHSGATLALADDNTCVISSTSSELYSYYDFSPNFTAAMAKGKNLEEVFLEIREEDDTPALPAISTYAGVEARQMLEKKMTPFLYYFDEHQDKLSSYLRESSNDSQQCLADKSYSSLLQTINALEQLNTNSMDILWWKVKSKEVDLSSLKELLGKYKKTLDLLRFKSKELGVQRLSNEEVFTLHAATVPITSKKTYTWKELITTDFKSLISKTQKRAAEETDHFSLLNEQGLLTFYNQLNAKKEELLKNQPDMADLLKKENEMKNMVESNFLISADIAKEERKLYSALYKNAEKKQLPTQANPCKDFKL